MEDIQITPFAFHFAVVPEFVVNRGDETGGAPTNTETSSDGIVKTDSEEDADVTA